MRSASRLAWAAALVVLTFAGPARADLATILQDVGADLGLSTGFDQQFLGFQRCQSCGAAGSVAFESLSEFNSNIVNDRVVPLSSSVTGFTYEYNQDLDIYERSTSTFGPLFTERAQTIGKGRFLMGLSSSYFEFDEFTGIPLDNLPASAVQTSGIIGKSILSPNENTVAAGLEMNPFADLDLIYDLEIEQMITSFLLTYGVTDRIDVGVIVPIIDIDFKAQAKVVGAGGAALPACTTVDPFSFDPCISKGNLGAAASGEDDYFGLGDIVLRGKYHAYRGEYGNVAGFLSLSLPTGSPEDLAGFDDPTYRPGIVYSNDFETPIGGLGIQSSVAWDMRPDQTENEELEFNFGVALQPWSRASFNIDFLGSHRLDSSPFGDDRFDLSIGSKFMVVPGVLADMNVVVPLNDDGLRTDAIVTAQLEWVFGGD